MKPRAAEEAEVRDLLAGKYRVGERVGAGGMGVVHAGTHLELEARVAIKLLQPAIADDPVARARFLREARLAASIQSEHSTRIHDVGTDAQGRPYLVMEFLAGEPLDARLAREGRLPLADAATILMQLLDALAEAHAKGLVHRDLKPANLFLAARPGEPIWVKVMDFGISKVVHQEEEPASLTAPRTLLGSPEYMSPEQLRDAGTVDARSDLWACGVLLHELLTGEMPFVGEAIPDLYAAILSRPPRALAAEGIPHPIVKLAARCLAKDPAHRPRDASELAAVLAPFARASGQVALPRIRAWSRSEERVRTPRRVLSVAGVVLVLGAGAAGYEAAAPRAPAPPRPITLRPPPVASAAPPVAREEPAAEPDAAPRPVPRVAPPKKTSGRRIQNLEDIEPLQ